MKKIIQLNETDLHNIIGKALNEALDKSPQIGVWQKLPDGIDPAKFMRMLSKKYGGEYEYDKFAKKYRRKKTTSAVPRQKISKPNEMSPQEYHDKVVIPNNQKLAQAEAKYSNEEWRPVVNMSRYFNGDADYSMYEVSNKARLRLTDFNDAARCKILEPYPAPTRKAMQFHLNSYDEIGDKMFTCPDVKYIVADAFLEKPEDAYKVIHKDGDWRNNNVENLKWVTKDEYRAKRNGSNIENSVPLVDNTSDEAIMEAVLRAMKKILK